MGNLPVAELSLVFALVVHVDDVAEPDQDLGAVVCEGPEGREAVVPVAADVLAGEIPEERQPARASGTETLN